MSQRRIPFRLFSITTPISFFITTLLLLLIPAFAQSDQKPAPLTASRYANSGQEILPATLGNGWRAVGSAQQIIAEKYTDADLFEIYRDYGLLFMTSRTYAKGRNRVTVQTFTTRYPTGAYGIFTWNRGSLPAGISETHAGHHVIRISGATGDDLQGIIQSIQESFSKDTVELSPLPTHLPEQKKIADSEKYITGLKSLTGLKNFNDLKEVISFEGGAEAVTAEYEHNGVRMNLLIIDCYTPQLSAENFRKLQSHIESLPAEEKSKRLIKRTGNYVIEIVGIKDQQTAQAIVDEIKYAPSVYWEGDRFTSIPYEFRPPDPLLVEETRRTGKFLTMTFFLIGLMIVGSLLTGVLSGAVFFQWRKWQRRRLGLEDSFSDAGGTLRLNLDTYLLPDEKSETKSLGKGD